MSEDIRHDLQSGMIVKVHQKIKELNRKGEEKQRIQIFEGIVLAVKHGKEPGATVTVRKISNGVGVEKIFPIHSPVIEKIELVRKMKTRQGRSYYLRSHPKKLREIRQPRKATAKKTEKKDSKKKTSKKADDSKAKGAKKEKKTEAKKDTKK